MWAIMSESAQFEHAAREFIETELQLCTTLLRSAAMQYDLGRSGRGDDMVAIVERSCDIIEQRFREAEGRGWDVAALRQAFGELQAQLASVKQQRREAA